MSYDPIRESVVSPGTVHTLMSKKSEVALEVAYFRDYVRPFEGISV